MLGGEPIAGTSQKVLQSLKELVSDINEDWEVGDLTTETRLVDLGLESISLVYLIAELQQLYGVGDRLFRKMRDEGTFLKDMTVGSIVDSLALLLNSPAP